MGHDLVAVVGGGGYDGRRTSRCRQLSEPGREGTGCKSEWARQHEGTHIGDAVGGERLHRLPAGTGARPVAVAVAPAGGRGRAAGDDRRQDLLSILVRQRAGEGDGTP
jgi:hypothetical protein